MKRIIILLTLLLTFGGGLLVWRNWQHDLWLKLVKSDLDIFWQKIDRAETPLAIVDGQSAANQSIEIQRLWGNQEQAEREHRQEIATLVNEQRQVVNEHELEVHPLLEQSARKAFENIADTKKFEHQDMTALLTRGEPFDRVGENLAAEVNVNPVRTVYDFYLSETHREIMLGDWEYIGVWSGWVEGLFIKDKGPQNFYLTVAHFGE